MKKLFYLLPLLLLTACEAETQNNLIGYHAGVQPTDTTITIAGKTPLIFSEKFGKPIRSYCIYSSNNSADFDPKSWELRGSNDGEKWKIVDTREGQSFCARFQENTYTVANPKKYKYYMFNFAAGGQDSIKYSDIRFFYTDIRENWNDFLSPKIDFRIESLETEGADIYQKMVQNPEEYIAYHARKVAEILYFSDKDSIMDVQKITYVVRDFDGISYKAGGNGRVRVDYSTRWIEHAAKESYFSFDKETRGVLYHELTHGYQYEPHGIGNYGNNKANWACIEGIADAVRAEAGLFDMRTRRPGGHWLDGYRTTGFFIQWLKTKDTDAIRKFHQSVAHLDPWSFDGAIKYVFGEEHTIESMWEEYQGFLEAEN